MGTRKLKDNINTLHEKYCDMHKPCRLCTLNTAKGCMLNVLQNNVDELDKLISHSKAVQFGEVLQEGSNKEFYLFCRVDIDKVSLVNLHTGNCWSDPFTYDIEEIIKNGIPLKELRGIANFEAVKNLGVDIQIGSIK